jgi:hypothetical protein
MKTLEKDNVKEFLRELSKLSRRYKISIGGCGCCGSPFLSPISGDGGRYETSEDFDGMYWKQDNDEPI